MVSSSSGAHRRRDSVPGLPASALPSQSRSALSSLV
jgi:hypothetical protein